MKLRWPGVTQLAMIASSLIAFATGGHFAAKAVIEGQQSRQLQELTDVALRRSEAAIDFGAATLDELARRGPLNCDPASLQAVRLQVYQRSAVKDIRLVNRDGSVICSAYSETLEFDNGWVARPDMLHSDDRRLLLFRVDQLLPIRHHARRIARPQRGIAGAEQWLRRWPVFSEAPQRVLAACQLQQRLYPLPASRDDPR
jgi:sensor c-di-GMP phosphodiesterase-like protein